MVLPTVLLTSFIPTRVFTKFRILTLEPRRLTLGPLMLILGPWRLSWGHGLIIWPGRLTLKCCMLIWRREC